MRKRGLNEDNKRKYKFLLILLSFGLISTLSSFWGHDENLQHPKKKPNFIIIFTDDLGYNDIECFGSPLIKTPRIDQMAKEGMRFTDYYAQTICGPSRSSLLTGCYPLRIAKKDNSVEVHPHMDLKEITIAEMLKATGYSTAAFGKWDVAGHSQENYDKALLPLKQGFDYYFGTPTSCDTYANLIRNDSMIERKVAIAHLTRRYTDEAIGFMERNKDKPFFIYLAHSMPHVKLGASDGFLGTSPRGLYGDVVQELDYNTGRILDKVKTLGLDDNTYIIFTSDNGPWWFFKEDGGSAYPLRGAKTSTWEGGLRVPFIIRAPGKVPANTVSHEVSSTLDLFPTIAKLAGGKIPTDRIIDGHDVSDLWFGKPGIKSPTDVFYYYQHTNLQAVRSGRWKLMLIHPASAPYLPAWAKFIKKQDAIDIKEPMLFDLINDVSETKDVSKEHPEIVGRLLKLAEKGRDDIGDYDRIGKGARFFSNYPKRPDIGNPFRGYSPEQIEKGIINSENHITDKLSNSYDDID